jgi:tetratricopeptide (TPR) repeat protein
MILPAQRGVWSAVFSPDGKTIAIGDGNMVTLFESATPADGYQPRINGEAARKIVDEMYQKYGFYHDVIDEIQADNTLDDPVRRLALQIANSRRWEDTDKPARKVVDELYKKYGYYYQVVDDLRSNAAIDAAVREIALQIATAHEWEDAENLRRESASVVNSPGKDMDAYRQALAKAEKAQILEPNDLLMLYTLGVAQYRVGAYEEALLTLKKADEIRSAAKEEPDAAAGAFAGMAFHQLGRDKEAHTALEQLRALCKEERFAEDQEAQGFLAEAEKLIVGEQ